MECIPVDVKSVEFFISVFDACRIDIAIPHSVTVNPSLEVVWEINSMMVSNEVSGLARQLMEMYEKSR